MNAAPGDINPTLNLRLRLVGHGYRLCECSGKEPLMAGWQRSTPTAEAVGLWRRDTNTGLILGPQDEGGLIHLIAIDIDVPDKDLAFEIGARAAELLGENELIRIGRAPRRAALYRCGPMKKRKVWLPAEDTAVEILGDGQQVIAYGTHPETRAPYTWPTGTSPESVPLEDVPQTSLAQVDAFIAWLCAAKGGTLKNPWKKVARTNGAAHANGAARTNGAMRVETERGPEGRIANGREQYMTATVFAALVGANCACPLPLVGPDLGEVREKTWRQYRDRVSPDDDDELDLQGRGRTAFEDRFNRALSKWDTDIADAARGREANEKQKRANSWYPPPPGPDDHCGEAEAGEPDIHQGSPPPQDDFPKPHVMVVADLDEHTIPSRKWLMGSTLLCGNITGVVAAGGLGKSSWLLGTALSLVTGRNLVGDCVYKAGPCWIHNCEDDDEETRRRLTALLIHHDIPREEVAGKLHFSSSLDDAELMLARQTPTGRVIHTPHVGRAIEYINDNRLIFAAFDPFVDLHEGISENDNPAVKKAVRAFRRIAHKTAAAIAIAHHTGKPPRGRSFQPDDPDLARGARAFTDGCRITQQLTNMTKEDAEKLDVPEDEAHLYLRRDDGKVNFSLKTGAALAWYRRNTVTLGNGDHVGVIAPHAFHKGKDTVDQLEDERDRKRIMEEAGKAWEQGNPLSHAVNAKRYLPRYMAALATPMKLGRARGLMDGLLLCGDLIYEPTGQHRGLRLPHQNTQGEKK